MSGKLGKSKLNRGFRQIWIRFALFAIVVPMLFAAFMSYQIYKKSMEDSLSQYSLQLTRQIATNLDMKLSSYKDQLIQVITDYDILSLLKSLRGSSGTYLDSSRLSSQVVNYVAVNPEIKSVAFLTEDKYIKTIFQWDDMSSCDEIFQKTITEKNKFQWYGSREQIYKDDSGKHTENVFSVSKEVNDIVYGGSLNAVIVIDFRRQAIEEICNRISEEELPLTWCIVDPSGNKVFEGNSGFVHENINVLFSDEAIRDVGQDQPSYCAETRYEDLHLLVSCSGMKENQWRIITFLDYDYIQNEISKSIGPILILFVLLLIFSTVGTLWMVKNITLPVDQLAHMMDYPAKGDFSHKVDQTHSGVKEIEVLQSSYNLMLEKINELINEVYQEGEQKRIVQIKALESQINPHFLYNTLDTIKWMALMQNADQAAMMASMLSRLLHISLSKGNDMIRVSDEIDLVKAYIGIQRFRTDIEFDVAYLIEPEAREYFVPKIILQPFVENSILHGFANREKGIIEILCSIDDGVLAFSVNDNGVGMDTSQFYDDAMPEKDKDQRFSGIGVKNVDERIKLICGKEYGVTIKSRIGYGTMVTITLPITTGQEAVRE